MRRSSPTGRVRPWTLRSRRVAEQPVAVQAAARSSATPRRLRRRRGIGLGVALLPMPFAFAPIKQRRTACASCPGWYGDAGPLSLYYPSRSMLPAKTRVFVDFVIERFRSADFARLVDGR